MSTSAIDWPYPTLIAHRGAGKQAPENTLAAFRLGAAHHFQMMEYDVKLSADGYAILLHDDTVDRTSNGHGLASEHTLAQLMQLDFGSWLTTEYVAEPICTLYTVARYTLAQGIHSNIEIKAETGFEAETGAVVARLAQQLWAQATVPPLLSSFSETTLEAARLVAPELPRALLIEGAVPADVVQRLQRLECIALNTDDNHTDQALVRHLVDQGYALGVWTVNQPQRAQQLLDWGCKSIFTDAIDCINPAHEF